MSIAYCNHCGNYYDQDFNVEHEEECKQEAEQELEKLKFNKIPMFSKVQTSWDSMMSLANKITRRK